MNSRKLKRKVERRVEWINRINNLLIFTSVTLGSGLFTVLGLILYGIFRF